MESSKIWLAGDATNMTEARLTPDAGPTMSNMTTSRTSSVSVARSVASSGAQEAAQTMLGLGVSRSQLQCPYVTSGASDD